MEIHSTVNIFWWIMKKNFQQIHQMFLTICFTNFFKFEQLEKKRNFLLVQNSFFFKFEQLEKKRNFLLVQNRFFFSDWQLKRKMISIREKKNHRFGIRDWWNYLMNSVFAQISAYFAFSYQQYIKEYLLMKHVYHTHACTEIESRFVKFQLLQTTLTFVDSISEIWGPLLKVSFFSTYTALVIIFFHQYSAVYRSIFMLIHCSRSE